MRAMTRRQRLQRSTLPVACQHIVDGLGHGVQWKLAFVPGEHHAVRIDKHERGPGAHAIVLPDAALTVIHDGMLKIQALNGGAQVYVRAFSRVLRAVDANDDQFISKASFKLPQLREYVQAVDSAVGPEVEYHQLAAQFDQTYRRIYVEPG